MDNGQGDTIKHICQGRQGRVDTRYGCLEGAIPRACPTYPGVSNGHIDGILTGHVGYVGHGSYLTCPMYPGIPKGTIPERPGVPGYFGCRLPGIRDVTSGTSRPRRGFHRGFVHNW